MRPKIKQPQEEQEEMEELNEIDEDSMEQEFEEKQKMEQSKKIPNKKLSTSTGPRFQAFAQPSIEGVYDTQKNEWVATNTWEMLSKIWNKLNLIESRLGELTE